MPSRSRQNSMATIDAVLANVDTGFLARQSPEVRDALQDELDRSDPSIVKTTEETEESSTHPATPKAAPGIVASSQARRVRARVAGQESEEELPDSSGNFRIGPIADIFTSAWGKLGQVELPGGIAVPLGVLLILTLVLITVKGHTRLGWLWLAITGNAEIGGPIPQPTILAPTLTSITGGSASTLPTEPAPTSVTAAKPAAAKPAAAKPAAVKPTSIPAAIGGGPDVMSNGHRSYSQQVHSTWLQEDL